MAIIRLTKTFTFEMAHALFNYDGKCKNIHGHSYKLEVTVKGKPAEIATHPKDGLLIDFGDLKTIVNKEVIDVFDHSLVMKQDYADELLNALTANFEQVIYVAYQPTCENLIIDFADRIKDVLPGNTSLHHLVLHETATAFCEWFADDQE